MDLDSSLGFPGEGPSVICPFRLSISSCRSLADLDLDFASFAPFVFSCVPRLCTLLSISANQLPAKPPRSCERRAASRVLLELPEGRPSAWPNPETERQIAGWFSRMAGKDGFRRKKFFLLSLTSRL